jgi:hypothetical protein
MKNNEEETRMNMEIRFADSTEGAERLRQIDEYTERLSKFDLSSKMQVTHDVSIQEFLEYVGDQALDWNDEQREKVTHDVQKLINRKPFLYEEWMTKPDRYFLSHLPLPDVVTFVLTTGEEESHAAYTRGDAIFLPLAFMNHYHLDGTIAHELFHIATRFDQDWKTRMYAAIGFFPCQEPVFPDHFRDLMITNPDAPVLDYCIRIKYQGEIRQAIPVIFSTDKYQGGSFFDYLSLKLCLIDEQVQFENGIELIDISECKGFFEQVGLNTKYIIHPEEILADNIGEMIRFGLFYQSDWSPEITKRIERVLDGDESSPDYFSISMDSDLPPDLLDRAKRALEMWT